MPYVHVRITREAETTPEMKAEVIRGITDVLARVLSKDPETTFVVIDEVEPANWGIAGMTTTAWRARKGRGRAAAEQAAGAEGRRASDDRGRSSGT
ncbi:MAG: 4-oxalocrotonate tautomerase family protein [Phycisphaerales bacterium]|nr:MAG: 4-oxalocrotonate tautomerase family protein [Phycisphaerales bacterium]